MAAARAVAPRVAAHPSFVSWAEASGVNGKYPTSRNRANLDLTAGSEIVDSGMLTCTF